MIILHESGAAYGGNKPMICPKCKRGRIGSMPGLSEAVLSRRGRPPPGELGEGVQIKCHICRTLWTLTIE